MDTEHQTFYLAILEPPFGAKLILGSTNWAVILDDSKLLRMSCSPTASEFIPMDPLTS